MIRYGWKEFSLHDLCTNFVTYHKRKTCNERSLLTFFLFYSINDPLNLRQNVTNNCYCSFLTMILLPRHLSRTHQQHALNLFNVRSLLPVFEGNSQLSQTKAITTTNTTYGAKTENETHWSMKYWPHVMTVAYASTFSIAFWDS